MNIPKTLVTITWGDIPPIRKLRLDRPQIGVLADVAAHG
jgi:hypothetical protein